MPDPSSLPAAAVEKALAGVLARPEFTGRRTRGLLDRLYDLLAPVREWLAGLVERVHLPGAGRLLGVLVGGALVLLAAGLLVHLVRVALGLRGGQHAPPRRAARPGAASAPADWGALAESAAAAGRFREAVLALYQLLLARLQSRGLVRYDAAKTPGEYRRELGRDPSAGRAYERFLFGFEPVAFGSRSMDRPEFERLRALVEEVAGG